MKAHRLMVVVATLAATAALSMTVGCSPGDPDVATPTTPPSGNETEQTTSDDSNDDPGVGALDIPALRLRQVATLDKPVAMATRPGSDDVFIAEQGGTVRRLFTDDNDDDEERDPLAAWRVDRQPVIDVSSDTEAQGEQGLLGLVFSPDGRRLYVHYTDRDGDNVVASYAVTTTAGGVRADPSTRVEVFATTQPMANHNGGQIAFGPDGYLYIGLGDGGGAGDPDNEGQNPSSVLGTVVRIDPDGEGGSDAASGTYSIPVDNPFADRSGAAEVWLYGVRNPWRFSFDRTTGDLWLADVGQSSMEEINLLAATDRRGRGANLGWRLFEGTLPHTDEAGELSDDELDALVWPVYEYTHDDGCSVTGGYVYRGSAITDLDGTYLFGDFCNPSIRALQVNDGRVLAEGPTGLAVDNLVSFGEDNDGELWVLSLDGSVLRILAG